MKYFHLSLLMVLLPYLAHTIQIISSYKQELPHGENGVSQKKPFNELKYGSPNMNFISGSGIYSGLYDQIKTVYGIPEPHYGFPHKLQQKYGPPPQLRGLLSKPISSYGPPLQNLLLNPFPLYRRPKLQHGPPTLTQTLPLFQPAPQFKPPHYPSSSYGPPPSGPLNVPPKQIFGPQPLNYGPPPLPSFSSKPEIAIIGTGSQNLHANHQQKQQQEVQIQIDDSGNTPSVTGSQGIFHTVCDGWRPILLPAESYTENNHIKTQTGYSQAVHGSHFSSTQHTGGATAGGGAHIGATSAGNILVNGISDEQLVPLALPSSKFDTDNAVQPLNILPLPGAEKNFNQIGLNLIEADALQLSLGGLDDSHRKLSKNFYTPSSTYSHKLNQHSSSHSTFDSNSGILQPDGKFERHPPSNGNYGSLLFSSPVKLGAPQPPDSKYLTPTAPSLSHVVPSAHSVHGALTFAYNHGRASLGIQYGKQTGNLASLPSHIGIQPSKPIAYIPPVPQGLFEKISATVQHLDKFGMKPNIKAPTYISPAVNEISHTGPENLKSEYGPLYRHENQIISSVIEQQLPLQNPHNVFLQIEQQQKQNNNQLRQLGNVHAEYGVPPLPPLSQERPAQLKQQYLPHTVHEQQSVKNGASYIGKASASSDNSAFASNRYQVQTAQPNYDCSHSPNIIVDGSFNHQQLQQQQQQYTRGSGAYISQSIPVIEHKKQLISGETASLVPPPSGGNELDNIGYFSKKSKITALPVTHLEGLHVFPAPQSEALHFSSQEVRNDQSYQQATANNEAILSADLFQRILNAVEQPQEQHQPLPINHKAESRFDTDLNETPIKAEDKNEIDENPQESKTSKIYLQPNGVESIEAIAASHINPIVV